jgi:hypothetical protein
MGKWENGKMGKWVLWGCQRYHIIEVYNLELKLNSCLWNQF